MARSPLHETHRLAGARFTDFGGWEMPVQYEGVLSEHESVRSRVGIFDVSHLGRFELSGSGATSALRRLLCNDITGVGPGRAQYTMALNESGGVIDDIIVWRWAEGHVWVLPNGANLERVQQMFTAQPDVTVRPLRESTVMLAVQGPAAPDLLSGVLGDMPGRFRLLETEFSGEPVWAGGTGYTGERGAELSTTRIGAADLWGRLVDAGATLCGLGARDTLRLEMGYPLWGQDLDESRSPLEAGLGWVVDWDHDFVGKTALEAQRADGLPSSLVAFTMPTRRPPRPGYALRSTIGHGVVTSGNFSPALGVGIGMGYLSPPSGDDALEIQIRDEWVPVQPSGLPFVAS